MTSQPNPREIAEKLTDAQRRIMTHRPSLASGNLVRGRHPDTFSKGERVAAYNLEKKGLLEFSPGDWSWSQAFFKFTPLGLQVRALLQEQERGL